MPFSLMICVNLALLALGFIADGPAETWAGFTRIIQSRSILVTDYIYIGGIGATLMNVSIVGLACTVMLIRLGLKPGGANVMAVWMSMGFAFFGKNVFNMIPLTIGVWLYSRYVKHPFSQHYLGAMLVSTLSPTISEIAFMGVYSRFIEIPAGIAMGFFIGFIFPVISAESVKTHNGFNLYNMGFAGGVVATVLATGYRNLGIPVRPASYWSSGNNVFMAALLYSISALVLLIGLFFDSTTKSAKKHKKEPILKNLRGFRRIHGHSGRLLTDYYQMYENSIYINMACLCAFGTTIVLILGAQLSGPAVAGILTMMAFGSLGKHMRNVTPIIIGAILSDFANNLDPAAPVNIVAILFSTGLAPLAGAYGPIWGIIAGFLHVNVATYIGSLNSGLNLYNNGFAATFVVMFLLPVITIFKKGEKY